MRFNKQDVIEVQDTLESKLFAMFDKSMQLETDF